MRSFVNRFISSLFSGASANRVRMSHALVAKMKEEHHAGIGEEYIRTPSAVKGLNGTDTINKDLKGVNILLVEDNKINQRVAIKTLTKWGAEVEIAENGKSAISMVTAKRYDIILMDIHMPEMDGYEATRYIRTVMSPPVSEIPIIAMTAFQGHSYEKAIEKGMNEYVSKPFKPDDFYRKIVKLLHYSHRQVDIAS